MTKPLEGADGDGSIEFAAAAGGFAGVPTYAAANRSEWIRLTSVTVSFLVLAFRNQGHITPRLRVNRTGLHAGKIGFQPVQINEFCPLLAHVPAPLALHLSDLVGLRFRKLSCPGQRDTVMLAVVDPETVTACVAGLPTSLQVFSV